VTALLRLAAMLDGTATMLMRSNGPDRQLELPTETYIGHPARCGVLCQKISTYTLSFSKHYSCSHFYEQPDWWY